MSLRADRYIHDPLPAQILQDHHIQGRQHQMKIHRQGLQQVHLHITGPIIILKTTAGQARVRLHIAGQVQILLQAIAGPAVLPVQAITIVLHQALVIQDQAAALLPHTADRVVVHHIVPVVIQAHHHRRAVVLHVQVLQAQEAEGNIGFYSI